MNFPTRHRPGMRCATLLAVLLAPLSLAACQWDRELTYGAHVAQISPPEASSNAFGWHQTDLSHLVRFAPGAAMVDPVEAVRLNQFIDQVGVQSNDEVIATVGGPMGQQRANAVVQSFALRGHRITPQIDPYSPEGDVTVTIRRVVYTASACLGEGQEIRGGGTTMPFGCANALNLQRMVVNPDELINNLGSDSVETMPAAAAIQRYRTGAITPLQVYDTSRD
ncbi:MAG: CpaD family pilus assembly lipoprotein [Alphaproteobacteria bacterium]